MSQEEEYDDEHSPDHWFSRFENECLGELEDQSSVESSRVQDLEEHSAQQSWLGFQQTSTAIAQLYNMKGKLYFCAFCRIRKCDMSIMTFDWENVPHK